jgi:hypothetical protein
VVVALSIGSEVANVEKTTIDVDDEEIKEVPTTKSTLAAKSQNMWQRQ